MDSEILRIHLQNVMTNQEQVCDIMIDQIRSVDNKRMIKKVGDLPTELINKVKENLMIVLDIE